MRKRTNTRKLVGRKHSKRGIGLLVIAVCGTVMLGMLGLAVDLGRAFIIKNEIQNFADAAAYSAAFELDGTSAGLTRANTVGAAGPTTTAGTRNRYNFYSSNVPTVQVTFAVTSAGPYKALAAASVTSRFVQVAATASTPLYFLRAVRGIGSTMSPSATAIAGQGVQTSIGIGSDPFSPDAHNPADPNFGFTKGQQYTLKWPPPGQRGKAGNTCSGDGGFVPPNASSDRGYIDVGQGNGNSALHDTIVNREYYLNYPYTVGSLINWVPGNKNVKPGMDERFNQDTDTTSTTYSTYTGDGRRILLVPVNDDQQPAHVAGFAAFFMPPGICGPKNTSPCCGEYIGPVVSASRHAGTGGGLSGGGSAAGLYAVRLFR